MKQFITVSIFLLFAQLILAGKEHLKMPKEYMKAHLESDFEKEVKKYCEGKPQTNFCSKKHIEIMLRIEMKRLQTIELGRQLKRMEYEIIRKVFNMNN